MRSSENDFFRSPGPLGFFSQKVRVGARNRTATGNRNCRNRFFFFQEPRPEPSEGVGGEEGGEGGGEGRGRRAGGGRGRRAGEEGGGLATNGTQKYSKKCPQNCVLLLERGIGKICRKKGLNLWRGGISLRHAQTLDLVAPP